MPGVTDQLNAALAGRYRIEREVGRGGMATVFLAEDLRHRRSVAIKVMNPEIAAVIGPDRFLREVEVAAGLNHPYILPLFESGSAGDLLYYVMPYVEGESLRQRLEREKQLPLADALRIAREVADALDHAHHAHPGGVVHRDVKPENILLAGQHAVVADFGIARAIVAAGGEKLTTIGLVIGTPAYMSPEQRAGSENLDGRSDLYSLGCVLYEMLAGQPPFTGATAESLAYQHLSVAARPVSELRPAVPKEIERAIQRSLAKAAADRFSTASEFAAAIAPTTEAMPAGPLPERAEGRAGSAEQPTDARGAIPTWYRGRSFALVGAVVVLALIAVAAWQRWGPFSSWLGGVSAPDPLKKEWILVAEFDGPADDSSLAVATRDLVSAALDQSAIVATVTRDQVRIALELAGKPATARVDAALAHELAYRSAVRAVVEGKISRLGQGYSIVVRVVDMERDSLVLSVSDVANDEKALIPTVERVARRIRDRLGERKSAIRTSRELIQVMTPSLEAYKTYLKALEMLVAGQSVGSIDLCREALLLDRDFMAARQMMGHAFNNLGLIDSALAAHRDALRRPERLSDVLRLLSEAAVADLQGDFPAAVAAYERTLQQHPSWAAHNNLAYQLYRTGHYEEALANVERGAETSPFGPNQMLRLNQFATLLALGRLDEGREVTRNLRGEFARSGPVWIALASGNWALSESLGTALEANPTASREMRRLGALAIGSAAATRGDIGTAERAIRRAEGLIGATTVPAARISPQAAPRARLLLALVSRGVAGALEGPPTQDTTTAALVTRGLWAAAAGDTNRARRLVVRIRSRPARELAREGAAPALLEAWIAAQGERWDETIRILGPAALQGSEVGLLEDQAGRVMMRWLVAQAYESLDRPDSAAAYLELVLSPLGRVDQEYLSRGIAFSFAHRRLVLLYARLGRLDDARRHWEAFTAAFRTPDPELRPLIEEARVALASAEGVAKSTRP